MHYAIETHRASINRACRIFGLSRTVFEYEPKKKIHDAQIKKELLMLASQNKRHGFRKLFQRLRKNGHDWNNKRVYRIYCELGLNLRVKPKKRLPSREKIKLTQPNKINICWSLDFMSDALVSGRKFRTVNVIDDFNREALGIKVSFSLPAERVIEFLDGIAMFRGYPNMIRVDNGPENISKTMVIWAKKHNLEIKYIQPGKPAQNAYIERFNRTYREDILDMNLFRSIEEVQILTDQWIVKYNSERPHQSLGHLTPWEYAGISKNLSNSALH